jgi:hypothetical protein
MAANVIDNTALAASAVTEIQAGLMTAAGYTAPDNASIALILTDTGTDIPATLATLATAANLATVAGYLDTEILAILEDTGTTLDAKIDTIDALIDALTVVAAAIKTKTDSLTFTKALELDVNAKSNNGAQIYGTGTALDLWRGTP